MAKVGQWAWISIDHVGFLQSFLVALHIRRYNTKWIYVGVKAQMQKKTAVPIH